MPAKKQPPKPKTQDADLKFEQKLMRIDRLRRFAEGDLRAAGVSIAKRKANGVDLRPAVEGLSERSARPRQTWRTMKDRIVTEEQMKDAAKVVDPNALKSKLAAAADYIGTYYGHNGLLRPEYDLLEPFTLIDTEAFLKQAINRKISLMFRNGFEISSDQARVKDYVERRLATMEYVTGRTTNNLFRSILFNLSLSSNCFVYKIRDDKASTGIKGEANNNKVPIAGYSIIPSHTIFPWFEQGKITRWRRFYDMGKPYDDIAIEDIIHFKWDVKPGHVYGTPRTVAVRDDIFALRRLEENIELLFINHLFPLYHVAVGTEDAPAEYNDGQSEVELIKFQVENMPKEGVFVTDERVKIDTAGAQGESLDFEVLLTHLKNRVFSGMGMSPLDMGEGDTANRATADNISQVLKDSIKNDLDEFSGMVRMGIFKELFQEASISLSVQGACQKTNLEWHEIDTDGRIKEETHAYNLYNSNLIGQGEARKKLKMKPLEDKEQKDTHYERHVKDLETHKSKLSIKEAAADVDNQKELAATQMQVMQAEVKAAHGKAEAEHVKAEAKGKMVGHQVTLLKAKTAHHKATGGSASKTAKTKKSGQNKSQPANQHGRNLGPTKAKSSRQNFIETLCDRVATSVDLWDGSDLAEWKRLSGMAVDIAMKEFESMTDQDTESSYTNQACMDSERLKRLVDATPDPEVLYTVLQAELDEETEEDGDEDSFGSGDSEFEHQDGSERPLDAEDESPLRTDADDSSAAGGRDQRSAGSPGAGEQ